MRLTILLLFLAVSAQAGLLDKAKDFFKRGNVIDRIKNATLTRFGKVSDIEDWPFSFGSKLNQIKKKAIEKLKHTLQKKKTELERKMKACGMQQFIKWLSLRKQADEVLEAVDGTRDREKRQAFKDKNYPNTTWHGAEVFYKFDYSAAEHSIVLMQEEGCWSYGGRLRGEQPLSLRVGCEEVGTAAHGLGYALGLFHTMSRYDRDDFITIALENVRVNHHLQTSIKLIERIVRVLQKDFVDQYIKETPETTTNYDLTYDYDSIMHYAKCLNAKSHQCENGGFPHPERCSECICPGGYGGASCNERPSGCGRTLVAKQSKQFLIDILGYGDPVRDEFAFCNYWIEVCD
ncbi:unnamed protein product [Haemonchus placei]|uniref:Metalloendopeptidase n=1 Tax=Haemonchus placei TaxID=6290 RepID=A0A0N4WNY5_HAEPC|nr:unnamed protein product [Haemonchus placei]